MAALSLILIVIVAAVLLVLILIVTLDSDSRENVIVWIELIFDDNMINVIFNVER